MLTGIATTSSSEDKFGRVKVKCDLLWEKESTLLPVMNNIFVSKGDEVVLFSPENLQQSLCILGVMRTKAMMEVDPIDTASRPVLFKAHVGSAFIIATLDESLLHLETNSGLTLDLTTDSVKLSIPDSYMRDAKTISEKASDSYSNVSKAVAIEATGGSFTITSKGGKELFSCLSVLFDQLNTIKPTTLGSPSAQNFNPGIVAALQTAKSEMDSFK